MTRSTTPSTSSSTLIVPPFPLFNDDDQSIPTKTRRPDLKLDITTTTTPYSAGFINNWSQQMSGKGFIEPHRNNLPRRKRRVVTAPVDSVAVPPPLEMEKTLSCTVLRTSEAGPRSSIEEYDDSGTADATPEPTTTPPPPIQAQSSTSSSSSSADTNITEPPSSLHPSPTPPQRSSAPSNKPSFRQTPKRALFHREDGVITQSPLPITPTKGHLQPTSATLPRRHRSLVLSAARERRRSLTDQQTKAESRAPDQGIRQTKADADTDSENQSMCLQELSKGVTLGFLKDGDDHVVRIKIYDSDESSTTPPSELHLQLSLPTNPSSHTDGTTSLTDSQIQQACTFIHNHLVLSGGRTSHMSVLILSPRMRPEEAMSIGVSYLAGVGIDKGEENEEFSHDHDHDDDHTYSTVHRLLMAFHDDPGSPISHHSNDHQLTIFSHHSSSWRGLRHEWRGILSFDGIQRLDGVWTK